MRELLVRREQDTGVVAATLRERGYATARGGRLEPTEVAQARLAVQPCPAPLACAAQRRTPLPPRMPASPPASEPALSPADVGVWLGQG